MIFRQITLLTSLFAALSMLPALAQAETWSCAYHDEAAKHPRPLAFTRNGGRFVSKILIDFVVVHESDQAIHLYGRKTKTTASVVVLNKLKKRFIMVWTENPIQGATNVTQWEGACLIF